MVNLLPPLCIPILLCHHHQTFMFLHFSMQSYRLERSSSCQPLCHLSRKSSRSLSRCTQCIFLTRTCMFAHVASLFIVILTIIVLWALVCSTTDTKNLWGMGFAKKMSFHGQLHLSHGTAVSSSKLQTVVPSGLANIKIFLSDSAFFATFSANYAWSLPLASASVFQGQWTLSLDLFAKACSRTIQVIT